MNFETVSDGELLKATKGLVRQERGVLVAVLFHLREIERRRLYCDLKYESMREYAIHELKYARDDAGRRLAAMQVVAEFPEIASKIEEGLYSLTNLALANLVFNKAAMTEGLRREFLGQIEGLSTRDAQKLASSVCPEIKPKDLELYQIKDLALREKAEKLLRQHDLPNLSALLHRLFDEELKRVEATCAAPRRIERLTGRPSRAALFRAVRQRDGDRCTNCGSTYKPQTDHIHPHAAGGGDSLENLRRLCRACNQRAAIRFYGGRKMAAYLRDRQALYRCS